MDCGWTDRRLASWAGYEGWWLRRTRRHHSRHPRRRFGRLGVRAVGNLAGRRHDRLHHCGICGRGDFGLDYPLTEKGLREGFSSRPRCPVNESNGDISTVILHGYETTMIRGLLHVLT